MKWKTEMLVLPKNHVNSETWQSWVILNCSSRESYLLLDLLSLSGPSPANGIYTPDFEKCGRQANQLSQIFRLLLSTMRLLQMPSWSPRIVFRCPPSHSCSAQRLLLQAVHAWKPEGTFPPGRHFFTNSEKHLELDVLRKYPIWAKLS